jgi:DNA-binding NtrC family response regulator
MADASPGRHRPIVVQCRGGAPDDQQENFDCVVSDPKMPGMNGVGIIINEQRRALRVQMALPMPVATAVEAMHGAFDYIEKPFDVDQSNGWWPRRSATP